MSKAFHVYQGEEEIDIVFYQLRATADEVRRMLIEHDGYPETIEVRER